MTMPGPEPKQERFSAICVGLAIGAGVGAALGAVVNNFGVWLPVGIGVGLALAVAIMKKRGAS